MMILGFTSVQRSLSKNRQVEGIGHSLIAGVIGMNMIARIEFPSNSNGALVQLNEAAVAKRHIRFPHCKCLENRWFRLPTDDPDSRR